MCLGQGVALEGPSGDPGARGLPSGGAKQGLEAGVLDRETCRVGFRPVSCGLLRKSSFCQTLQLRFHMFFRISDFPWTLFSCPARPLTGPLATPRLSVRTAPPSGLCRGCCCPGVPLQARALPLTALSVLAWFSLLFTCHLRPALFRHGPLPALAVLSFLAFFFIF